MARPTKEGLDYFPLDCRMDDKFDFIEAKHGLTGWAVLIKIYQKIYFQGYHLEWNEKTSILFASKNGIDIDCLNQIILDALEDEIFNKFLYKKFNILTSSGIQKRYVEATKRRKQIKCIKELALIDFNVNNNSVNVNINTQSKVKKSKVKESKGNPTLPPNDFVPSENLIKWASKERYWSENLSELIDACLDHHRSKGNKYTDWEAVIRKWCRNDKAFYPDKYKSNEPRLVL